jgi:polyferredoxin
MTGLSESYRSGLIQARRAVQLVFLFTCIFIGIRFYLFVCQAGSGGPVTTTRPAGVEAFLPISALVSFKYFLCTRTVSQVHPAGLIIFTMICFTALMMKKVFCSWICPFGLLSDCLENLHSYVFPRTFDLPRWLDIPMRGTKYLLAGFFIWAVFVKMRASDLNRFIMSTYNVFADVKMLNFFTDISVQVFCVIMVLVVLSVVIPRFWCRYLCPYGALLGVLGMFSLCRIQRNHDLCIGCGRCERICPGRISIMNKKLVKSFECTSCLRCIESCPEKNAIVFSVFPGKISLNQRKTALILLIFFAVCIITAMMTDHWSGHIPVQAYRSYLVHHAA